MAMSSPMLPAIVNDWPGAPHLRLDPARPRINRNASPGKSVFANSAAIMANVVGKIDGFGRVLIPKAVRDHLGMRAGDAVSIVEEDGHVRIIPGSDSTVIRRASDGFLVLWAEPESIPTDPVAQMRESRLRELRGSQLP